MSKKKYVAKYTLCQRCGENYLDDPYYEHVCKRARGLIDWIESRDKPVTMSERTTVRSATLTGDNLRRMYEEGYHQEAPREPSRDERQRIESLIREQNHGPWRNRILYDKASKI